VAKRSPILGYNHNVRYRGLIFHVQTEDSGLLSPHLFTHLFYEGVIVSSRKLVYDAGAAEDAIKGLMQAQHKVVLKDLRGGKFDDKIDQYLAGTPGLLPRGGAESEEPVRDSAPAPAPVPARAKTSDELELSDDEIITLTTPVNDVAPEKRSAVGAASLPPAPPIARPPSRPGVAPPPTPTPSTASRTPSEDVEERPGAYSQHRRSGSDRMPVDSVPAAPVSRPEPRPHTPTPARVFGGSLPVQGRSPSQNGSVVMTRPAVIVGAPAKPPIQSRVRKAREDEGRGFGQGLISEKSLDEVILAYLSEGADDK
jgi:hypothetical protein